MDLFIFTSMACIVIGVIYGFIDGYFDRD